MTKEEFRDKMYVMLDVLGGLSAENKSKLMIYGSDGGDRGVYFTIKSGELYSYNVEFGIGDDKMVSVESVSGGDIHRMFSEYVISTINVLHVSVVI